VNSSGLTPCTLLLADAAAPAHAERQTRALAASRRFRFGGPQSWAPVAVLQTGSRLGGSAAVLSRQE
jgi:hypothetical protein